MKAWLAGVNAGGWVRMSGTVISSKAGLGVAPPGAGECKAELCDSEGSAGVARVLEEGVFMLAFRRNSWGLQADSERAVGVGTGFSKGSCWYFVPDLKKRRF